MAIYRYQHGDRPLEGYTIQHALGRGGFGEVYYAISDSGREVALKSVLNHEDIELRGIKHCMNLKHPQLVSIFDIRKNDQGQPFVLMEYVDGPSLRQILDTHPNGLGADKAAFFFREIAKGLSYLHDNGIVHRDLKPHNVFYEHGVVKIGDYSLSKAMTTSHRTGHSVTVGTVHYMAPEISIGRYDHGVDIYALGVLLYEMLTGHPPFLGDSMGEVLMKHVAGKVDLSGIEQPFARVIEKALAKQPEDRYATAQEMVDDLFGHQDLQNSVAALGPESLTMIAQQAVQFAQAPPPVPPRQSAETEAFGETPGPGPTVATAPSGPAWNRIHGPFRWIGFAILLFLLMRLGFVQSGPKFEPSGLVLITVGIVAIWAWKKRRRNVIPPPIPMHHMHAEPYVANVTAATPAATSGSESPDGPSYAHRKQSPEPPASPGQPSGPVQAEESEPLTDVSQFGRFLTLVLSAIPFLAPVFPVAGLHRFYVGRTGSGLLWLFTWGLFGIGTIVDMVMISLGQFRDSDGNRVLNFTKEKFDLQQPVNEFSAVARDAWTESRVGLRLGNLFLNLVAGILLIIALLVGTLVSVDFPGAMSRGAFGSEVAHDIADTLQIEDWDQIARGLLSVAMVLTGTVAAGCLVFARREATWRHLFRVPFAVLGFVASVSCLGAATRFGNVWREFAVRVNERRIAGAFETLFQDEFWMGMIGASVLFVVSMFILAWPARPRFQAVPAQPRKASHPEVQNIQNV